MLDFDHRTLFSVSHIVVVISEVGNCSHNLEMSFYMLFSSGYCSRKVFIPISFSLESLNYFKALL